MDKYIPEDYVPNDRYYLSLWLCTFESFIERPALVIDLIESTFAFADPFTLDLRFVANPHLGRKEVHRKFTPKTWEWCKQQLERGMLELFLTYRKQYLPPPTVTPHWVVNIMPQSLLQRRPERNAKGFILNPVPNQFRSIIEFPHETKRVSQDVQEKMAHLARTALVNSGAMYGFITVSRLPPGGTTEYEDRLGVSDNWYVGLLRKFVRGAFWENYLTEEHIQELGGVESIKSNAPCARVDELIQGRALALRLTEDINDVTAANVEKLEEYFRPLSPTQDKVLQR